jgi:Glutamine amidotransferase domain
MLTLGAATDRQLRYFKQLLLVDQMRGEHATGVYKVNTAANTVGIHKKALDAVDYLALEETKEFLDKDRGRIYVGHNRYATVGKRDDSGAHPFSKDHITLVHNGSVDYWTMDELSGYEKPEVTVDSEMVCHTLAELGTKAAVETKFSGAFSLVWWNDLERSLNFIRNDERPMYMAWLNDGAMVWASEKEFIDLIVNRDKVLGYVKDGEPAETTVGRHYKWTFDEDGKLENEGAPVTEDYTFHTAAMPWPNRRSWGASNTPALYDNDGYGYVSYGAQIVRHGIPLGTQYSVTQKEDLLESWGLGDIKLADEIVFDVLDWRPYNTDGTQGTLSGNFEGHDVACYSVPRDLVHNTKGRLHSKMKSRITSVYEGRDRNAGLNIVVSRDLEVNKGFKPRVVIKAVSWPMRVEGFTFRNEDEFKDTVSCGCALCGVIPSKFDINNKHMHVYITPSDDVLPQYEYICGACIINDESGTWNLAL